MDVLEKNYSDHTFCVNQLTEHGLIKRMQLHRKAESAVQQIAWGVLTTLPAGKKKTTF
jgi:hypothetical protein